MSLAEHHGTDGRTYGGDPTLVHIEDHHRRDVGMDVAEYLSRRIRNLSKQDIDVYTAQLCPGCYMIALIDAAITLAAANGQSLHELGKSMAEAFQHVAEHGKYSDALIEEMHVVD